MTTYYPPKLTIPIQLIGIAGKAHSGKDTVANMLHQRYLNCWVESFADPLKECCAAAFGLPVTEFYDQAVKERLHPAWGVSPRQIVQFVGTEFFRTHLWGLLGADVEDFWIRRLVGKLSGELKYEDVVFDANDTVVIPDVRFTNEAEFILANNGVILRLTRPGVSSNIGIPNHISEKGIDWEAITSTERSDQIYDLVNDNTLETLSTRVQNILSQTHLKLVPQSQSELDL